MRRKRVPYWTLRTPGPGNRSIDPRRRAGSQLPFACRFHPVSLSSKNRDTPISSPRSISDFCAATCRLVAQEIVCLIFRIATQGAVRVGHQDSPPSMLVVQRVEECAPLPDHLTGRSKGVELRPALRRSLQRSARPGISSLIAGGSEDPRCRVGAQHPRRHH